MKTNTAAASNSFDTLLGELDTLQKSFPQGAAADAAGDDGDAKIREAAGASAEGAAATAGTEDEKKKKEKAAADAAAAAAAGGGAAAGAEKPMAKSFLVKDADGNDVEASDAGPLLEALQTQMASTEAGVAKVMGGVVTMMKSLVEQNAKLAGEVAAMRADGRGRKAVVTVTGVDVTKENKGAEAGMEPKEFFAKALQLQSSGLLGPGDIARCEAYINRGMQPPADVVAKVAAASAQK